MNGWAIAGIIIGALVVAGFLLSLPDLLRYLKMRRM